MAEVIGVTEKAPEFEKLSTWPIYLGTFIHRWQISNFNIDTCHKELESKPISRHHDSSTVFKMILVPGSDGASKYFNIRLRIIECINIPIYTTITYTVSNNMHETDSFSYTHYFTRPLEIALEGDHKVFPSVPWGYPKDGGLDIYCTITANLCHPTSVGRVEGTGPSYFYFQEVPHYRRMMNDKRFKDAIISSMNMEYKVHRALAASASPLCRKNFEFLDPMEEEKIYVEDIPKVTMTAVLEYMYVGWTTSYRRKYSSQMEELIKAANRLEMTELKSLCEYEIVDTLVMRNSIRLLKFAVENNCKEWLKPRIIHFMRLCKNRIIKSSGFRDLCEDNEELAKELYPEHFALSPKRVSAEVKSEVEKKYVQYVVAEVIDI